MTNTSLFGRMLRKTQIRALEKTIFGAEFSLVGSFEDSSRQTLNFFAHTKYHHWQEPIKVHSAESATRGYHHDTAPYILGFEELDALREKTILLLQEHGLTKGVYLFCNEINPEELKEFVKYSAKDKMLIKPHIIHEEFLKQHFKKQLTTGNSTSAIPQYTLFDYR